METDVQRRALVGGISVSAHELGVFHRHRLAGRACGGRPSFNEVPGRPSVLPVPRLRDARSATLRRSLGDAARAARAARTAVCCRAEILMPKPGPTGGLRISTAVGRDARLAASGSGNLSVGNRRTSVSKTKSRVQGCHTVPADVPAEALTGFADIIPNKLTFVQSYSGGSSTQDSSTDDDSPGLMQGRSTQQPNGNSNPTDSRQARPLSASGGKPPANSTHPQNGLNQLGAPMAKNGRQLTPQPNDAFHGTYPWATIKDKLRKSSTEKNNTSSKPEIQSNNTHRKPQLQPLASYNDHTHPTPRQAGRKPQANHHDEELPRNGTAQSIAKKRVQLRARNKLARSPNSHQQVPPLSLKGQMASCSDRRIKKSQPRGGGASGPSNRQWPVGQSAGDSPPETDTVANFREKAVQTLRFRAERQTARKGRLWALGGWMAALGGAGILGGLLTQGALFAIPFGLVGGPVGYAVGVGIYVAVGAIVVVSTCVDGEVSSGSAASRNDAQFQFDVTQEVNRQIDSLLQQGKLPQEYQRILDQAIQHVDRRGENLSADVLLDIHEQLRRQLVDGISRFKSHYREQVATGNLQTLGDFLVDQVVRQKNHQIEFARKHGNFPPEYQHVLHQATLAFDQLGKAANFSDAMRAGVRDALREHLNARLWCFQSSYSERAAADSLQTFGDSLIKYATLFEDAATGRVKERDIVDLQKHAQKRLKGLLEVLDNSGATTVDIARAQTDAVVSWHAYTNAITFERESTSNRLPADPNLPQSLRRAATDLRREKASQARQANPASGNIRTKRHIARLADLNAQLRKSESERIGHRRRSSSGIFTTMSCQCHRDMIGQAAIAMDLPDHNPRHGQIDRLSKTDELAVLGKRAKADGMFAAAHIVYLQHHNMDL